MVVARPKCDGVSNRTAATAIASDARKVEQALGNCFGTTLDINQ
jgi:hypothetical protein